MKKLIMFLLAILTAGVFTPTLTSLGAPTTYETFQKKSSNGRAKTVKVKGYTTKKGKYVKPYTRSRPSKRH